MSLTCYTCGNAAPTVVETRPEVLDRCEALGRQYFGLPQDAALCPTCSQDVISVGRTLWEEEIASFCPACRKETGLEEEWMAGRGGTGTYRVSRGARA